MGLIIRAKEREKLCFARIAEETAEMNGFAVVVVSIYLLMLLNLNRQLRIHMRFRMVYTRILRIVSNLQKM